MYWFILVAILCIIFYYKCVKPIWYWDKRGVASLRTYPIFGSFAPVVFQRQAFFNYTRDIYRKFPKERFMGAIQFGKKTLYIKDLELIKKITVKDFDHFTDHNTFIVSEIDAMNSRNLFNLKGQRWRDMRATLSPSFTSSKMKMMFTLVSECAQDLVTYFEKQPDDLFEVEMKDVSTKFTNDAIASTAFGLKCNTLEDPNNDFYLMAKEVTSIKGLRFFALLFHVLLPKLAQFLKIRLLPARVSNYFRYIIQESIRQREKEGLIRPDMIHLLMEARKGKAIHDVEDNLPDTGFATVKESSMMDSPSKRRILDLSDDDITSQALIFIFGGFDTTSSLICFISYELAMNSDVHERLQDEVDETLSNCNGVLTYEALHNMKYMDMVVSETLRKWPPGFQMDRVCVTDYEIKPTDPCDKPLLLEKGHMVIIPVVGIHHDPEYYPNPEVFDPERFSDENKHKIRPFTYFPFGSGPRNCIASRFALMECKTIMFHLLSKFDIVRINRTPDPLKVQKTTIIFMAEGGFWVGLKRRNYQSS